MSASLTHCNDVCYFITISIFFVYSHFANTDRSNNSSDEVMRRRTKTKRSKNAHTHFFSLRFSVPAFMRKVYGQTLPDKKNINAPHSRKFSIIIFFFHIVVCYYTLSHRIGSKVCVHWNPQLRRRNYFIVNQGHPITPWHYTYPTKYSC